MNKFFRIISLNATSEAMERETISKNRVSPKNDRSRNNHFIF
jgi:hypothetical protein